MNKLFALMGIITMLAGFAMLVGAGMQSSAHAAPGDITLQFTEFINAETGDPLCLGIAQHQGANTGEVFLLLATDADCNPPAPTPTATPAPRVSYTAGSSYLTDPTCAAVLESRGTSACWHGHGHRPGQPR